jgi:tetratricopeptide (TPR) repeat protein
VKVATEPLDDLKRALEKPGQVIAVVGAGLTINCLDGAKLAALNLKFPSWTNLLLDMLEFAEQRHRFAPELLEIIKLNIGSGNLELMLGGAQSLRKDLGEGDVQDWLETSVGQFKNALREPAGAILALHALGIPVITLNYDDTFEHVTGRQAITWKDTNAQKVITGDRGKVLHLHGYYERADTVILTSEDYANVTNDPLTQALMAAMNSAKTLLFVGCGETLNDPNFGRLFDWARPIFRRSSASHFLLEVDDQVIARKQALDKDDRIQVIGYGKKHDDLAGFLQRLAPTAPITSPSPNPVPIPAPSGWKRPGEPDLRIGGQDKLTELVGVLLEPAPQPVLVLGLAGIGKSNLCEHALADSTVRSRFASRRAFVHCDAVLNCENLIAQIATEIAVPLGPNLEPRVFAELEREPCVLVLDNLETPWRADALAVEDLLKRLAGFTDLRLLVAVRGSNRPVGLHWHVIRPDLLSPDQARALFLELSETSFASDPNLDPLLELLEGLPLAIKLLAPLAQGASSLTGLVREYDDKRTELLNQGFDKAQSLSVSLELSFTSPRMTDAGRTGASVLALLPDGVLLSDLPAVLEDGDGIARVLRAVGLAFDREGRLRMLAPVREHVALVHQVIGAPLKRAVRFYAGLIIENGKKVGQKGGAEAIERLKPEFNNASVMTLKALEVNQDLAVNAAYYIAEFTIFSDSNVIFVVESIREAVKNSKSEANLVFQLGEIALARSKHEAAQIYFKNAISLYRRFKNEQREASCIARFGKIALFKSDNDNAKAQFKTALHIYRRFRNVLGQANCIQSLGIISFHQSEYNLARSYLNKALVLFNNIGQILGKAFCMQYLGMIAFQESDHDVARVFLTDALLLFKNIGSVMGEVNCILSLGEMAIEQNRPDDAQDCFQQALKLSQISGEIIAQARCIAGSAELKFVQFDFDGALSDFMRALQMHQEIVNFSGQATCQKGLGKIAQRRFNQADAKTHFLNALELYGRIPETHSMGLIHHHLSEIARDSTEREYHLSEARRLWFSINRPDLIAKFLD